MGWAGRYNAIETILVVNNIYWVVMGLILFFLQLNMPVLLSGIKVYLSHAYYQEVVGLILAVNISSVPLSIFVIPD